MKFRFIFFGLLLMGASEQIFLKLYLDKIVLNREEDFLDFIDRTKANTNGTLFVDGYVCEYKYLGILKYNYQMCIYGGYKDRNGQDSFGFAITEPAGYITLIPWYYPDRRIIFRVWLFALDKNGKITEKARVRQ